MDVRYGLLFMLVTVAVLQAADVSVFQQGLPDTCLKGPRHKDTPSPESDDFLECRSWKNLGCCNINVSHEIHHNRAEGLYNYFWDRCGQLSQACEQYLKNEECFYQCEPMLKHYERPGEQGYIRDVPICAQYCDAWFEACKDDMTCVEDWLEDWTFEDNGLNHCPENSNCVKFSEMYGDAKGLCDKMWGDAFYYEESNTNCMVMEFNPDSAPNPNLLGIPPASSSTKHLLSSLMIYFVGFILVHFI